MLALVTGGGGFLGRAIARKLVARGDRVRSIARGDYPELRAEGIEAVRGDVADEAAVAEAARGCDVVFHVAAKAGVWGPEAEYRRANVDGTRAVLAACRIAKVPQLVYTSSPSVVIGADAGDIAGADESRPYPDRYATAYPATKAEAERLVLATNSPDLLTVSLRPHLIWGPGDNHLIPRLVARARSGRLRRVGAGTNLVDTIFVDNAADAHLRAADRLAEVDPATPPAGRAYFIAQNEPTRLWELVDGILRAAGLPPVARSVSPRAAHLVGATLEAAYRLLRLPGEPPMTRFVAHQLSASHWFDITAARRDLGYAPAVSTAEGLDRLAAWFAAHPP